MTRESNTLASEIMPPRFGTTLERLVLELGLWSWQRRRGGGGGGRCEAGARLLRGAVVGEASEVVAGNGRGGREMEATKAAIIEEISLQALMRHQYQRRRSTEPVPAPMPRRSCQADWMLVMLAAA